MTNKEILEKMPIGEVVPKRILSAMKRKGLIFDYSPWGYLESARIWYKEMYNSREESNYVRRELFPNANAHDCEFSDLHPGLSREEIIDKYTGGHIEYLGFTFDTQYLSGCFSPYLVKTGPKTSETKTVKRSMSLWGAIM